MFYAFMCNFFPGKQFLVFALGISLAQSVCCRFLENINPFSPPLAPSSLSPLSPCCLVPAQALSCFL